MMFFGVEFFISHNQGVPGSSPGGTTDKQRLHEVFPVKPFSFAHNLHIQFL